MQSNKKKNPKREERFLLSICCWYFIVVVAVTETFTEKEEFRLVVGESWTKEVISHPEEVLVTVILVPLPIGCCVVTVIEA